MTQSIPGTPASEQRRFAAMPDAPAETATPLASELRRRRARTVDARPFPVSLIVAACIAVHLLAAALLYRDLAPELYALFDATPRLLVLEQGLRRLTATTVFLPPVVPTVLVIAATFWLGRRRSLPHVARWLALSVVPLAIDGIFRAIGVILAPPPSNMGELLDLPMRFSVGPRLLLDLAGAHPSAGVLYWSVVATIPAALSAWCVARALLAAEDAEREAAARRRRRTRSSIDALQVGVAVVGSWIALAFAGQVVLPWAVQLFLKAFG